MTGAGQGIGKGVAIAFASLGAYVVVADRNAGAGEQTAGEILTAGAKRWQLPLMFESLSKSRR